MFQEKICTKKVEIFSQENGQKRSICWALPAKNDFKYLRTWYTCLHDRWSCKIPAKGKHDNVKITLEWLLTRQQKKQHQKASYYITADKVKTKESSLCLLDYNNSYHVCKIPIRRRPRAKPPLQGGLLHGKEGGYFWMEICVSNHIQENHIVILSKTNDMNPKQS